MRRLPIDAALPRRCLELREERLDHEATPGVAAFKGRLLIYQPGHWTS
jgi:hypothetical protein